MPGSDIGPAAATVVPRPGGCATRVLRFGAWTLVVGVLVYFAARSTGGGVAGILLSSLIWWGAFEFAMRPLRAIWRTRENINLQHITIGGCLTAVSACAGGSLIFLFGPQLLLGLIIGPLIAYARHQGGLISITRSLGMDPMPSLPTAASLIHLPGARLVMAVVGLVSFLAGLTFIGLGTVRSLEPYAVLADVCTQPCGMVHGVWVDVVPATGGALFTRLDPSTVELQVRFRDDMPGARVVSRDNFTLEAPPVTFLELTARKDCPAWPPHTLHIDETTAVMPLCFEVPGSADVDFSQLVLDWRQPGDFAQISLGKRPTGSSPSPS